MSSSRERLEEVLSRCPEGVTHRPMMGEYVLYYRGKVVGGIYDDRFLVKPTRTARELLPDARQEIPYEGAKPMLLVPDDIDDMRLKDLLVSIYGDLPRNRAHIAMLSPPRYPADLVWILHGLVGAGGVDIRHAGIGLF
jgi:TfoX/Sxy family transcriptional regulator of competence genes